MIKAANRSETPQYKPEAPQYKPEAQASEPLALKKHTRLRVGVVLVQGTDGVIASTRILSLHRIQPAPLVLGRSIK